jgi:hypothetical protein
MNLPIELKTRIYNHIGTVQKHLAELPPDEQREILQSLETHIHEALQARSNGTPDLEILEAIITEMDPPESYATAPLIAPSSSLSLSSGRKILFISSIAILCILFIAIWLADPFSSQWMEDSVPEEPVTPTRAIPKEVVSSETIKPKTPRKSPLIGKWATVDFVASISELDPKRKHYEGEFKLKGLEFRMDGKTDKPWWTWQDNQLFHSGDQSTGEVVIITVNRDEYLFMEWISGDVLNEGQKPNYYVLERGGYLDPKKSKTIIEGDGWEVLHLGATREELIAEFGFPDSRNSMTMSWQDKHIACILSGRDRGAAQLNFGTGSRAITSKGVGIGDSEETAIAVYGNPSRVSTPRTRVSRPGNTASKTMTWLKHGVQITFKETKVDQIDIIKSQVP